MFINTKKLIWIWIIRAIISVNSQDPAVNLRQGRLVGIKVFPKNSLNAIEIFYGVPYATPPIGRYRFSAPERHAGWRRTLFAHRAPPRCPRPGDAAAAAAAASEDCLYLNVYTPRRADGAALPVVVVLYSAGWGGAGGAGGAALPGEALAAEGCVVVAAAARLHALGFLTLRSVHARGNYALLDQYFALLWVRENIAAFGGDPHSVTLLGHSAGADAALRLLASPRTAGLFHRAIVMSPLEIWNILDEDKERMDIETAEAASRDYAKKLGCFSPSDEDIMRCLRNKPLAALLQNSSWVEGMRPIPDSFLPESEQFLPTPLSQAFSAGNKHPTVQLDLLLGTTDLEIIRSNSDDYDTLARQGSKNILEYARNVVVPEIFSTLSLQSPAVNHSLLTDAVLWEYLGGAADAEGLARLQSSARWGAGAALLAARLARRVARLHVYRYTEPRGTDLAGRRTRYNGAVHGSDLTSLFGSAMMMQVARRLPDPDEEDISVRFRRYVVNFIKFGSPSAEDWAPYKAGEAHVHTVGGAAPRAERDVEFWLQYLPRLAAAAPPHAAEQQALIADAGRGGVAALSLVSALLLLLLAASGLLLQRERRRRPRDIDDPAPEPT